MRFGRVPVKHEGVQHTASLSGKTIVVTRRAEQAEEFSALLKQQGAAVLHFPAVEIAEPASWIDCDAAIARVGDFSGILFTSRNAVQYFFRHVRNCNADGLFQTIPLYAVGEKTAKTIEEFGFHTAPLPEHFSAEEMAKSLVRTDVAGKRYLFPKGNLARTDLVRILTEHGAVVDEVVVYQTREPARDEARTAMVETIRETADLITFFSPSGVDFFLRLIPAEALRQKIIAVFGGTTAAAAVAAGLRVDIVSPASAVADFAEAIRSFFIQTESTYETSK